MWVSGRDLCRAFEHVVDEERISFGVYNLVSHNPGMRWEIATLTRDLDFVPQGWGEDARCLWCSLRGWPGYVRSARVSSATDSQEPAGNRGGSGANGGRA